MIGKKNNKDYDFLDHDEFPDDPLKFSYHKHIYRYVDEDAHTAYQKRSLKKINDICKTHKKGFFGDGQKIYSMKELVQVMDETIKEMITEGLITVIE